MENFVHEQSCVSDSKILETYDATLGWDGNDLKYAGISIESSILDPFSNLPEDKVRDHYDMFIAIKDELDASMSNDCQSNVIFSDSDQKFIFMNNQKIYRTSAIGGSLLGVVIAFVVLLASTRNVIISFFATISILSVLVTVIGIVSMLGWTLGTNEAILMSILAGFSVDYVVHLAHAYVESEGLNNVDRIKGAFGDMGTSVFSGMLTSVIASVPLFFCTLTFFAKFGICELS
jgi:multidrug efflux pump subunit AcrB